MATAESAIKMGVAQEIFDQRELWAIKAVKQFKVMIKSELPEAFSSEI